MNDFTNDLESRVTYLEDLLLQFTELFDTEAGEVIFIGDSDDTLDLIEVTLQAIASDGLGEFND